MALFGKLLVFAALMAFAPVVAAAKPSQSTATFVKKAEMSGEYEVGSSRLAQDKAKSQSVKDFAAMMIKDHTDASEKLRTAAEKEGLPRESATQLDEKHAGLMRALESAKPDEFDRTYIEQQRRAHEEAVDLFKTYAKSEKADGAVKQFASDTLPVLEEHLKKVKSLSKDNRGS